MAAFARNILDSNMGFYWREKSSSTYFEKMRGDMDRAGCGS